MDTQDKNTGVGVPRPISDGSRLSEEPELLGLAENTILTAPSDEISPEKEPKKSPTPFQESMKRLMRDKRAVASIALIVFFILLAIFGPPIYQHIGSPYQSPISGATVGPDKYHNPFYQELDQQDQFISGQHWLGTDSIGRDMFARLMQGLLVSMSVAILVEIVDITLGISIGVLAGYYGGWIDNILARFTDIMFAFPGLLFVILLTGIFGTWADDHLSSIPVVGPNGNARLLLVSMALAFTAWPIMARYVRGQTLQIKEQQFVEAARTSGTANTRIILRHIVPNLFSIVIVASTLNIANTIVGEAGISLLGLGVQSPGSSIGLMISDAAGRVDTYPWEVLLPSIVLALIVLAFSFLGDGLRDAFDPRSKD
ncbi:ABC transporter permease [Ktedonosporobacter rubrisoli]|uniref:ABC transporter permease n=1 Tax=Ktedonosporobacter rubrisoli TaxID=2509675 RepID=A0A4P6K1Y7_KTERU|nr:ABC transporter permease [Ktedonosporobacter rubrisoli]QBD82134.1 ABC transporter permease [Ktedonosporobacter rubrisoli]